MGLGAKPHTLLGCDTERFVADGSVSLRAGRLGGARWEDAGNVQERSGVPADDKGEYGQAVDDITQVRVIATGSAREAPPDNAEHVGTERDRDPLPDESHFAMLSE